jgi:hypothetical protein
VISNIGACAVFAALTGSSPACCAAIGKMGIPEMRRRGYPDDIATGSICAGGTLGILIPPSITFILYGIATETVDRAAVPGRRAARADAHRLFILWTLFIIWKRGFRSHALDFRYSWKKNSSRSRRSRRFSDHRRRDVHALRRRRDPVGGSRHRRGACAWCWRY